METLKTLLNKHKSDLKPVTKENYLANFKKVLNEYTKEKTMEEVKKNIRKIVPKMEKDFEGKKTLLNYIYILRLLFEMLCIEDEANCGKDFSYIKKKHQKHKEKYDYDYVSNKATNHMQDSKWTIKSIQELMDKEFPVGDLDRLIIEFYLDRPPRNDLVNVKLYSINQKIEKPNEGNYIILDGPKGTLVINEYKTDKKHGQVRKELNSRTMENLHASLLKDPRDHLFINKKTRQPYSEKAFNTYINRKFKKIFDDPKFTINTFRHLYITHELRDKNYEEREKVSKVMGHSMPIQKTYEILEKENVEKNKKIRSLEEEIKRLHEVIAKMK